MAIDLERLSLSELIEYMEGRKTTLNGDELNSMLKGASDNQRSHFFANATSEVNSVCAFIGERLQVYRKTINESVQDNVTIYDSTDAKIRRRMGEAMMDSILVSCIPVFKLALEHTMKGKKEDNERSH